MMQALNQFKQKFSFSSSIKPQYQHLKRFYKKVSVQQSRNPEHPSHQWQIKLDGKFVRTPFKNILAVPTIALAHRIAHEFNNQTDYIQPHTMPLLQMARTAIDSNRDYKLRRFLEFQIIHYLQTDVVLFREDKTNKLYQIQSEKLDLLIASFNKQFRVNMELNNDFDVQNLKLEDLQTMQIYLQSMDSWHLISLQNKAENLKSTILASALQNNIIDVETAVAYSRLEEQHQINTYGKVDGHHDVVEQNLLENIQAANLFEQTINSQEVGY